MGGGGGGGGRKITHRLHGHLRVTQELNFQQLPKKNQPYCHGTPGAQFSNGKRIRIPLRPLMPARDDLPAGEGGGGATNVEGRLKIVVTSA